jgi:hypothetical protein
MQEPEAKVWLRIDRLIVEAECSICHDTIYRRSETSTLENQDQELREALARHTAIKHARS